MIYISAVKLRCPHTVRSDADFSKKNPDNLKTDNFVLYWLSLPKFDFKIKLKVCFEKSASGLKEPCFPGMAVSKQKGFSA